MTSFSPKKISDVPARAPAAAQLGTLTSARAGRPRTSRRDPKFGMARAAAALRAYFKRAALGASFAEAWSGVPAAWGRT